MSNQYQPRDTKDALRYLEKLANRYLKAPLTPDLLAYNQKQINYLRQQVVPIAQYQEHNQQRAQQAKQMAEQLELWQTRRLAGLQVPDKMHHFQLVTTPAIKYHHQKNKTHQPGSYRAQKR